MTEANYVPTPEQIAALCDQMRRERAAGLVTVQIKTKRGPRWIARPQGKQRKPTGSKRGQTDEYQPTIYRLKLS